MNRFATFVVAGAIASIAFTALPAAAAVSPAPAPAPGQTALKSTAASVISDFCATDVGNAFAISGTLTIPDGETHLWSRLRLYREAELVGDKQVALKAGTFDQSVPMADCASADRVELRVGTDQNMYSVDTTDIRFQTAVTDHLVDRTGTSISVRAYSPQPGRDYKLVIKPWAGGPNIELPGRGTQEFSIKEIERSPQFVCVTVRLVDAKTGAPLSVWVESRARVNP